MHAISIFLIPVFVWGSFLVGSGNAFADTRLPEAAKAQDTATVRELLAQGVSVDAPLPDGATALHWAAHWSDVEALNALLGAGASVDVENDYGATALWVACANRNRQVVQRLLEAGANPNTTLHSGETSLMRCVHTGDAGAVGALVEYGAAVEAREPSRGQTALMRAIAGGHPAVVRLLVERGADVTARTEVVQQLRGTGESSTTSPQGSTYFEAGGFTPLLFAARHGHREAAMILLDAGAEIDEAAGDGNTPLVGAAMSGHGGLAEWLLDRGADPNASGAGYTALHAAVMRSQPSLMASLLSHGANPDVPLTRSTPVPRWTYQYIFTMREKGATPLLLAAKYLEPEMVDMLAEAGADPWLELEDGTTALMAAVGTGLSRSTTRRSRLIAPELVSAEWNGEERVLDTVHAVIAAGAVGAINQRGRGGNTALHGAARNRFTSVAGLLVAEGADLDVQNDAETTPREMLDRLSNSQ